MSEGVYGPGVLGDVVQVVDEPLVAGGELLRDGEPVAVGLVVHHPAAGHYL